MPRNKGSILHGSWKRSKHLGVLDLFLCLFSTYLVDLVCTFSSWCIPFWVLVSHTVCAYSIRCGIEPCMLLSLGGVIRPGGYAGENQAFDWLWLSHCWCECWTTSPVRRSFQCIWPPGLPPVYDQAVCSHISLWYASWRMLILDTLRMEFCTGPLFLFVLVVWTNPLTVWLSLVVLFLGTPQYHW